MDKDCQCDLEKITHKDIQMLELMRGIQSQPLRKEFLKQKDPTLETLLQIANNWQRSADVDKNMESNVDARKATSSYKKGKQNEWKAKSASGPSQEVQRADNTGGLGIHGLPMATTGGNVLLKLK